MSLGKVSCVSVVEYIFSQYSKALISQSHTHSVPHFLFRCFAAFIFFLWDMMLEVFDIGTSVTGSILQHVVCMFL